MPAPVQPDRLPGIVRSRPRVAAMFTADWCGPCIRFKPHFAAAELGQWEKVMVDASDGEHPAWGRYLISVVPTVVFYRDGREAHRIAGVLTPADLAQALARVGPI